MSNTKWNFNRQLNKALYLTLFEEINDPDIHLVKKYERKVNLLLLSCNGIKGSNRKP